MMLLTLFALAQAASEPAPVEDRELVVVAERMRKIKYTIGRDKKSGAMVCRIRKSSGDARLDGRICELARGCIPANARRQDGDRIGACIEAGGRPIIAEFAAERRAAAARR